MWMHLQPQQWLNLRNIICGQISEGSERKISIIFRKKNRLYLATVEIQTKWIGLKVEPMDEKMEF